jgi:hypothetical protein
MEPNNKTEDKIEGKFRIKKDIIKHKQEVRRNPFEGLPIEGEDDYKEEPTAPIVTEQIKKKKKNKKHNKKIDKLNN